MAKASERKASDLIGRDSNGKALSNEINGSDWTGEDRTANEGKTTELTGSQRIGSVLFSFIFHSHRRGMEGK